MLAYVWHVFEEFSRVFIHTSCYTFNGDLNTFEMTPWYNADCSDSTQLHCTDRRKNGAGYQFAQAIEEIETVKINISSVKLCPEIGGFCLTIYGSSNISNSKSKDIASLQIGSSICHTPSDISA